LYREDNDAIDDHQKLPDWAAGTPKSPGALPEDHRDDCVLVGFEPPAAATGETPREEMNDVQATRGYDRSEEHRLRAKLDEAAGLLRNVLSGAEVGGVYPLLSIEAWLAKFEGRI
jgi:hypothetical protein